MFCMIKIEIGLTAFASSLHNTKVVPSNMVYSKSNSCFIVYLICYNRHSKWGDRGTVSCKRVNNSYDGDGVETYCVRGICCMLVSGMPNNCLLVNLSHTRTHLWPKKLKKSLILFAQRLFLLLLVVESIAAFVIYILNK